MGIQRCCDLGGLTSLGAGGQIFIAPYGVLKDTAPFSLIIL